MSGKRGILIATTFFFFAVLMWGGFIFLYLSLGSEEESLVRYKQEKESLDTRSQFSNAARANLRETTHERAQVDAITSNQSTVSVIQMLEDVGDVSGTTVRIDAVSATGENDVYQPLIVALRAEGSFQDVMHALVLFEAIPIASVIDQFELEKENAGEWNLRIRQRVFVDPDTV